VDAHVSRELFDHAIVDALKKRGKSVILCTHQMQYLQYADKVLVLDENGNQKYFGTCFDSTELETDTRLTIILISTSKHLHHRYLPQSAEEQEQGFPP